MWAVSGINPDVYESPKASDVSRTSIAEVVAGTDVFTCPPRHGIFMRQSGLFKPAMPRPAGDHLKNYFLVCITPPGKRTLVTSKNKQLLDHRVVFFF